MLVSGIPSQPNNPVRIAWLDYAKGIGIILVVYGHVISGLSNAGVLQTISVASKQALDLSVQGIYTFHMPLFFFLSGLLLKDHQLKTDRQRLIFAKKKISSLMYPYLIWSIIFGATINLFSENLNRTGISWASIPYQIAFNPTSHMWFLYALCLINLAVLGLKRFLPTWMVLGLSIAAQLGASLISGIISYVMYLSIYFVLGNWLSTNFLNPKLKLKSYQYGLLGVLGVGIYIAGSITILTRFDLSHSPPPLIYNIFAILGILMTICLSYGLAQANQWRWLKILGENSFYIYILHMLSWVAVRVILLKILKIDQFSIHFVLAMIAGLVPPIIIGHIAQKHASWLFNADGIMNSLKRA
jgi:fucose 4-O-acetylase-like acetyltransferase